MSNTLSLRRWLSPCPRCLSSHCKSRGKMYPCRRIGGSELPNLPEVSSFDDCVPGANSTYVYISFTYDAEPAFIYCDAVELYGEEELEEYTASDYDAPPLLCDGPGCVQSQYELYASRHLFVSELEDTDSRYRAPGADQPALFRGELGETSSTGTVRRVVSSQLAIGWSLHS